MNEINIKQVASKIDQAISVLDESFSPVMRADLTNQPIVQKRSEDMTLDQKLSILELYIGYEYNLRPAVRPENMQFKDIEKLVDPLVHVLSLATDGLEPKEYEQLIMAQIQACTCLEMLPLKNHNDLFEVTLAELRNINLTSNNEELKKSARIAIRNLTAE